MKAISLKQPWASMISDGRKTIETRGWPTNYRGDLLIVSSKKPVIGDLPCGKALCIVHLVDCREMYPSDQVAACCDIYEGAYAWVLRRVRRIADPFSVKGALGLYNVEVPKSVIIELIK